MVVWICTGKTLGQFSRDIGRARGGTEVELAISEGAVWSNQLICMYTEASHTANRCRDAARSKKMKKGVAALRMVDMEIPKLNVFRNE